MRKTKALKLSTKWLSSATLLKYWVSQVETEGAICNNLTFIDLSCPKNRVKIIKSQYLADNFLWKEFNLSTLNLSLEFSFWMRLSKLSFQFTKDYWLNFGSACWIAQLKQLYIVHWNSTLISAPFLSQSFLAKYPVDE